MVALPWDFLPVDARQADAKEAFALYRRAVFSGMGEAQSALGRLQTNTTGLPHLKPRWELKRRPSHYLLRDSEWVSAIFCALLTHNASGTRPGKPVQKLKPMQQLRRLVVRFARIGNLATK